MFAVLKGALNKSASQRTAAEQKLIKSFATYIQQRRTYLAEQALEMYDSWKTWDDQNRQQTGQSRSLSSLFYYGTVPLDFHGTLSALMTLGGAGGGTMGTLVAFNQFAKSIEFVLDEDTGAMLRSRASTLPDLLSDIKLLKSVQGLSVVSGASAIEVVFAVLTSVAIDQFIAIETARPKLEASLALAKQPVDLDLLKASDNGEDMLYLFWSKAMDAVDVEDFQVLQLAAVAQARAAQSGYAAPPKSIYRVSPTLDRLSSGTTSGVLNQGEKLVSANGKYRAEMQTDGNFVIYTSSRQAIWATGTNGKGSAPYKLAMQADSNLVVYGRTSAIWASGVHKRVAPYTLIMQDDGNLVIVDRSQVVVWQSGTKR